MKNHDLSSFTETFASTARIFEKIARKKARGKRESSAKPPIEGIRGSPDSTSGARSCTRDAVEVTSCSSEITFL